MNVSYNDERLDFILNHELMAPVGQRLGSGALQAIWEGYIRRFEPTLKYQAFAQRLYRLRDEMRRGEPMHWLGYTIEKTGQDSTASPAEVLSKALAREAEKFEVSYQTRRNRFVLSEAARTRVIIEGIKRELDENPVFEPRPKARPQMPKVETAVLLMTDWHLGGKTDPSEVMGLGQYSSEIALRRINEATDQALELIEARRHVAEIRKVHINYGGDLIDGVNIYEAQPYHADRGVVKQLVLAADMIVAQVRRLSSVCPEGIDVTFQYGNHSRIGRKGQNPSADSFESILFEMVKPRLIAIPGVRVTCAEMISVVNIEGWRFGFLHGDSIRGSGRALQAGTAKLSQALSDLLQHAGHAAVDFVTVGHFHQAACYETANGGSTIVNGSPKGCDDFSFGQMMTASRPTQTLLFLGESGISGLHVMQLEPRLKAA